MAKKNAVAYTRVSTKSDAQFHSYEYQNEYWRAVIADNPENSFCKVYADLGISGKAIAKRPQFLQMMQDARNGKIDVIYTKSVARFARNTEELLLTTRELRDIGVKIIFEKERIDTFDPSAEVYLTVAAAVAENDLKIYSENQRWAIRNKFAKGYITIGNKILGYRMNPITNTLEVEPEEAETVRMIFELYLSGLGLARIIREMTARGRRNIMGEVKWSPGTLHYILTNEKYKGCALTQKTVTSLGNCKPNKGETKQYYMESTHEAIIKKDDFDKVQQIMYERATKSLIGKEHPAYAFSHLIECGVCGAGYRHKIQNPNKPYAVGVWVCCKGNLHGKSICDNKQIKQTVLETLFVECYNEFIAKRHTGSTLTILKDTMQKLVLQEQELNAMRVNRLIALDDYNTEEQKLRAEIRAIKIDIDRQQARELTKADYKTIETFQEDKVKKFIEKVTIHKNVVTFIFINGVKISRTYTNGPSGNQVGWLDRKKEREAKLNGANTK